jgi:hypothetical protein
MARSCRYYTAAQGSGQCFLLGGGFWFVSLYLAFYVRYMMTDMWNMTDFCIFVYNKTAIEYVGNDKI